MKEKLRAIFDLLDDTRKEWSEDKASRLAAALSYYTAFSIGPLLLLLIAIVGLVYGQQAAEGQISGQIKGIVGDQGAQGIQTMIQAANKPSSGIVATVIGIVTLILGAIGVFGALQDALNTIWNVEPDPNRGWFGMVKDRFVSFSMVLGVGFLLLVSLVISAVLSVLTSYFGNLLPGMGILWQLVSFVVSLGVVTLLFAMIYKVLPDAEIHWGDVWLGALVTALLFAIGKEAIAFYMGTFSVGSSYGVAGSFVVMFIWIYYAAQILLFGAEFTQVYAGRYGSRVVPASDARWISEESRAEQGLPPRDEGAERRKAGEEASNQGARAQEAGGNQGARPQEAVRDNGTKVQETGHRVEASPEPRGGGRPLGRYALLAVGATLAIVGGVINEIRSRGRGGYPAP